MELNSKPIVGLNEYFIITLVFQVNSSIASTHVFDLPFIRIIARYLQGSSSGYFYKIKFNDKTSFKVMLVMKGRVNHDEFYTPTILQRLMNEEGMTSYHRLNLGASNDTYSNNFIRNSIKKDQAIRTSEVYIIPTSNLAQ